VLLLRRGDRGSLSCCAGGMQPTLILGLLVAAPVMFFVERRLTFLAVFAVVAAGVWHGAPQLGFGVGPSQLGAIFIGLIAGALVATSFRD
jgi:hypothetical protein